MEKNSQKKGSLPKGGEPNGGVKKALQKDFLRIVCHEVELDYKRLYFNQTGLCPYRSKNKKAYKAWLNEMLKPETNLAS